MSFSSINSITLFLLSCPLFLIVWEFFSLSEAYKMAVLKQSKTLTEWSTIRAPLTSHFPRPPQIIIKDKLRSIEFVTLSLSPLVRVLTLSLLNENLTIPVNFLPTINLIKEDTLLEFPHIPYSSTPISAS